MKDPFTEIEETARAETTFALSGEECKAVRDALLADTRGRLQAIASHGMLDRRALETINKLISECKP